MPSPLNHYRNHTWPPGIHLIDFSFIKSPSEDSLPDIEDDPFAHFISPVNEDDDPYDILSLSAGIIIPEENFSPKPHKFRAALAKRWARYISRNHSDIDDVFDHDDQSDICLSTDTGLTYPESEPEQTRPRYRTVTREPTRGRAQELVGPITMRRKGRRATRTLSGHRHSWQEPSADLFTVMEEAEAPSDNDKQLEEAAAKFDPIVRSARGPTAVIERSKL